MKYIFFTVTEEIVLSFPEGFEMKAYCNTVGSVWKLGRFRSLIITWNILVLGCHLIFRSVPKFP